LSHPTSHRSLPLRQGTRHADRRGCSHEPGPCYDGDFGHGTSVMNYSLPCECGRSLSVAATAAGSTLVCQCGRSLLIPQLSKLRLSAGQEAYGRNTADTIARMVRSGALPSGEICAVSGRLTQDIAVLCIECERVRVRGEQLDPSERMFLATMLRLVFLGLIGSLLSCIIMPFRKSTRAAAPPQERGRQVVVQAPLYVCSSLHARLKRRGQRYLKELLGLIPIYATLLKEYPEATVLFARSIPHDRGQTT
jgi:hypothetical protein